MPSMSRRHVLAATLSLAATGGSAAGPARGTSRRVGSTGAQLATEAFGAPERGTILLVMGATASMLWWPRALCESLAASGYQMIRFDHRDTGGSTTGAPGAPDYDLDVLQDDLLAILDAYGAGTAHLVGMSLGGYLSQLLALRHPARVASLVLIASEPVGGTGEAAADISPEFMAHFSAMQELDWSDRQAVRDVLLGMARLSVGPRWPFDAPAARERIDAELDRTERPQSAFNHALLAGDIPPGLTAADIRQPALVIHGSHDPVIPLPAGKALAAMLPEAQLLVLEGVGHELPDPELPRIGAAILAFLNRIQPA